MIQTVVVGALTLYCDFVSTPKRSRVIRIEIPGRDNDVHQIMGKNSRSVELRGMLSGTNKDTDKATLEGYEGTTKTYNDGVNSFTMIVTYVDIPTIGGQPNHYIFTVRGFEYVQ